MPRILNLKSYSFNAKIALSLIILAVLLIVILFSLIVPKMQKDKYDTAIKEIEQVLSITEEQIKLAGKAIVMQSKLEIESNKNLLELQLANAQNRLNLDMSIEDIEKEIKNTLIPKLVSYAIKYNNKLIINKGKETYHKYKLKEYDKWEKYHTEVVTKDYVDTEMYFFYTKKISNNLDITIFASEDNFNPNHFSYEELLKENMQNTFNITQNLHKGKTYMFWFNSKYKDENDKPLYIEDKSKSEEKYTLSKMSNVNNIYTGNLTAKSVLEGRNQKFVEHTLDNKEAISWIIDVYEKEYDGYVFLLVKTIYKEDLIKHMDSSLKKILPAAFISLLLAVLIGFFLFRNLFKRINILTNTAKEVICGNKKTRSNVKGKDDIGYLGIAFDSMIDSFENNIKTLDLKVEEKTKKLQLSLNEKEILLKEIHHRVKNNLALTISLIKLQEEEIEEDKAKKSLNDIQERIYTMELLHRKLYESTNLNQIDFNEYVINLVKNISDTYTYNNKIESKIEIKNILLNIEKAMPCGLILNEIITNAFKYAFKNNKNPKLSISMKKNQDKYTLIVKDNGKGIHNKINIYNSTTLGLKLINSISILQLNGSLEYKYEEGSVFIIIF